MATELICSTSKQPVTNDAGSVRFTCPSCANTTIIRTRQMRAIASKYTCHGCGFVGPTN